jgi:hypothetical protein
MLLAFTSPTTINLTKLMLSHEFRGLLVQVMPAGVGDPGMDRSCPLPIAGQPNLVSLRPQLTAKVMRAATGFHRYDTARPFLCKFSHRRSPQTTAQNNPTAAVQADDAANILAQINAKYHDIHWSAPLSSAKGQQSYRIAEEGRAIL